MELTKEDALNTLYNARTYLLRTIDPLSRDYISGLNFWRSRLEACEILLTLLRQESE